MNRINPAKLKDSKWTDLSPKNKEKHFIISQVVLDDQGKVVHCELEAIMTGNVYQIDWRSLKEDKRWSMGWK